MFDLVLKFSGIIAIFFAWLFLVFPHALLNLSRKTDTISDSMENNRIINILASFGLILGALFQALFGYFLSLSLDLSLLNPGIVLYLTTCFATILVVLFPRKRNLRIHNLLSLYYFIFAPISLILIGSSVFLVNYRVAFVSFFISILYFIFQFFIIRKYRKGNGFLNLELWANVLMEIIGFLFLSAWTIWMTFLV